MKSSRLFAPLLIISSLLFLTCNKETPVESSFYQDQLGKLVLGYKTVNGSEFHHYVANREFGIWPRPEIQLAAMNNDPVGKLKLRELKEKWGFTHIAAMIGVNSNIMEINQYFPVTSNYMALIAPNAGGFDAFMNVYNGMGNTSFMAYYMDEPANGNNSVPETLFKNFCYSLKLNKPNSIIGFGETTAGTGLLSTGISDYDNPSINFFMCTRYFNLTPFVEKDQRPVWTDIRNYNSIKFKRTWIAAHEDGGEFETLLGYCINNNIAPWFYHNQDYFYPDDSSLYSYCAAACIAGFLTRYDRQYTDTYKCYINHTHLNNDDPNNDCTWTFYNRAYYGIISYTN